MASCGCVPTVHQMSLWAMAKAWVASKVETLSEISTINVTPASRARAMTASRSSSNWGACRFTWLSISIQAAPMRWARPISAMAAASTSARSRLMPDT